MKRGCFLGLEGADWTLTFTCELSLGFLVGPGVAVALPLWSSLTSRGERMTYTEVSHTACELVTVTKKAKPGNVQERAWGWRVVGKSQPQATMGAGLPGGRSAEQRPRHEHELGGFRGGLHLACSERRQTYHGQPDTLSAWLPQLEEACGATALESGELWI